MGLKVRWSFMALLRGGQRRPRRLRRHRPAIRRPVLGIFRVHGLALTGRLEALGLVRPPTDARGARSASAEQSSRNLTADGMARISRTSAAAARPC